MVSPTIGKGLCVVNFLTRSDSGTRDYTVYVVALLVMECVHKLSGSLLLITGSANLKLIGSLETRLI